MYSTSANDLEQVANDLSTIAKKYSDGSQEMDQQVITLEGAVSYLLSGGSWGWKGLSSEAFLSAWLERKARLQQASQLMSQSAGYLAQMARTIEDNLPAIRADENVMYGAVFHTLGASDQTSIMGEMSQAQTTILMAISVLNSQLEALAEEVSDCPEVDRDEFYPGNDNVNYTRSGTAEGDGSGSGSQPTDQPSNEVLLDDPTLIQKEEMIFEHSNEKEAFESTLKHLEQAGGPLPDDFEPTPVKVNPGHPEVEGLNNGMGDNERGWRIDFDEKKGIHFNWYDWTDGSRKSGLGRWGAETFPGTYEDYIDLLLLLNVDGVAELSN